MADIVHATLNGHLVTDARVTIPGWGISYHDVSIDGEITLSGAVTLQVADLTIKGTVLNGGPAQGRSFYRIVAGAGGWGKFIKARAYSNDLGVAMSTILNDAAGAVGETVDISTINQIAEFIGLSGRVGPFFVRPEDQASRVLEMLSPSQWYVREDGVTLFGKRPTTTLPQKVAQTSQVDLARGTVTLASETIANILPGVQVAGLTAIDVEHTFSAKDGLRSKIWGKQSNSASRRVSALRAITDQFDPDRRFHATYEYRIVVQTGNRLNLQPVRTSTNMPSILRVYVRPGLAGCSGQYAIGSRVLVSFIDGDGTRPAVVAFEDPDGAGFTPTSLSINAGQVLVGPAPEPLAYAAPLTTVLSAIETWIDAMQTAMGTAVTVPALGTAMSAATTALNAAIATANAAIPTTVLKGT